MKDYSGPDPKELSENICKLISQSVDTTDLISDAMFSKFSNDIDLAPLIQHVEDVIRYKPSLRDYTEDELLECYILQSLDKCVKVKASFCVLRLLKYSLHSLTRWRL